MSLKEPAYKVSVVGEQVRLRMYIYSDMSVDFFFDAQGAVLLAEQIDKAVFELEAQDQPT